MASRVHDAIQAWWAGQSALQAMTVDGRLWHIEAPEDIELPFAAYAVRSESERDRTTAYYHLDGEVVISIYASTDVQAATIRNDIREALRNASLSDEGETPLYCLPGNQSLGLAQGDGPDGSDCWLATIEVSIPWQRNP